MRRPVQVAAVVTAVLATTFVAILGIRLFRADPAPGRDDASVALSERNAAVAAAAEKATLAFLDVDYRSMDSRIDKVLALATGTFKEQYSTARTNLASAAVQGKATSIGKVNHVGISEVTRSSAVALVAADSTVSNSLITEAKAKGQSVDEKRYYRFRLDLRLVKGTWLVNDLQFVG
ncbi:Mce-associated membrane protein [Marmoricola sp. OAE513]|uniref:hypothetical protein n=1 Tax=Marmoricola sp. OAE513 TaxID=2817894 RepID=UPI001AE50F94